MKKLIVYMALFMAGVLVVEAQTCGTGDCACASCLAKEKGGFSLPGLQGLEEMDAPAVEAAHDDHADHDHAGHAHAAPAVEADHDDHAGHDHAGHAHTAPAVEAVPHEEVGDHAGHDHGAVGGIQLSQTMFDQIGIQIRGAQAGTVAKSVVFPAEIKLNRDTTAAISPRYTSIVRKVYAEIGDDVQKGDVLAALENRETMAVYDVTAPHAGTIISKDLAVGEVVADDKTLFEVADLASVWADINIFPQYQHLLAKGMEVNFIARDGCVANGQIKYISPIISHETRTFTARCVLKDARTDFTPGAFVRAQIVVETVSASVVVPREAVQMLDGESVVFVPSANGFIPESVSTGLADEQNIEITQGLQPGSRYVAVGAFSLKAQMVTSGMDPHAGHGH
ncbi:MAG: efflux RND transporter periplasmic adaptor subunit [Pontiella sp.]